MLFLLLFLYLLLSSFCQLPSELTEENSTKPGHLLESECDLKMYVRNLGFTVTLNIGGPNPSFSTTCNLTTNLTAYIFGIKHDIRAYIIG